MAKKDNSKEKQAAPSTLEPNKFLNIFYYVGILIFVFLTLSIRSKFNEIPFERDEGTYSYYGQLVLDGKPLYTSFDAMKFPGIYYAYAFFIAVFGNTIEGIHNGFMWMNIISMLALIWSAKILFDEVTSIIVGAAFVVISMNPLISGFTVQSEHIIAFCVSVGLLFNLLAVEKSKHWFYFIGGIFLGGAIMIKQSAVFYIPVIGLPIVFDLMKSRFKEWKAFLVKSILYSVGVVLPFLVGCLIVLKQGVWEDFVFWTLEYPKSYASQVPFDRGMEYLAKNFGRAMKYYTPFWYMAFISIPIVIFVKKVDWYKKVFYLLLALAAFATVVPGFRFYGHYWLQMLPVWALLIGLTFYAGQELLAIKVPHKIASFLILVVFLMFYFPHIQKMKVYYFTPNYTKVMREVYGINPFPEAKVIGEFIKGRTQEGDQVAILGSEPQVNFYSDRRAPSRHAYMAHLVGLHPKHKEWQQEFIADVEKAKPKMIVFFDHSVSWIVQKDSDKSIFKWMNTYLPKHYKTVGIADMQSAYNTQYLWDEKTRGYKPKSKYRIFVYERKDEVTTLQSNAK